MLQVWNMPGLRPVPPLPGEDQLGELMGIRPIPFKALRRLIAKEENAQLRQLLFEQMAGVTVKGD